MAPNPPGATANILTIPYFSYTTSPPSPPPGSRYVRSSAPAAEGMGVGGRGGGGREGAAALASFNGRRRGRGRGRVGEGFKPDM